MDSLRLEELDAHHVDPTPLLSSTDATDSSSTKRQISYKTLTCIETPQALPWTMRSKAVSFVCFLALGAFIILDAYFITHSVMAMGKPNMFSSIVLSIYPAVFYFLVIGGQYMTFRRMGPVAFMERRIQIYTYLFGKDSGDVCHIWFRFSVILEIMGQTNRAIDCCRHIVTEGYQCNSDVRGAPYHFHLGKLLYSVGKYDECIPSFEAAARLIRQRKGGSKLPIYLHCIGFAHEKSGRLEEALKYHKLAVEELNKVALTSSQTIDAAKSLIIVGAAHASLEQFQLSLESYEEALSIYLLNFGEFPHSRAVARLHVSIGEIHKKMLNSASALESYHLAIDVYRRCGLSDENTELAQVLRVASEIQDVV